MELVSVLTVDEELEQAQGLLAAADGPRLTGATFMQVKTADPGIASYITTVERGYAVHELTFALPFMGLIAFPFLRRRVGHGGPRGPP
jgi:hypothetical protein